MTSPAVETTEPSPGRAERWSDRVNAILLRELQQAVKGRAFAVSIMVALTVVVVAATRTIGRMRFASAPGRDVFDAGLALLCPLVLFVVPMQAFQSMRLELRGGIVEQLLLSRLRPRAILAGKLQAALVQFLLYVSLLSPLLATSYLLRGVDLPTIGLSLLFALVLSLVATAFAVSAAAQAMLPALQGVANLATALGLGISTVMMMGFVGSGAYSRFLSWTWTRSNMLPVGSAIVLLSLVTTALAMLAARSHLLHAFENRSTGFRALLFACPPLACGWTFLSVTWSHVGEVLWVMAIAMTVVGIVFGIFMVTEQRSLSVRLRVHVPRGGLPALLAAPFLPGRDRGFACFLLYLVLVVPLVVTANVLDPSPRHDWPLRVLGLTGAYAITFLALLHWLRGRLQESVGGNFVARFLAPVLIAAGCLVPALIDVFTKGEVDEWHFGHLSNPFWTIAELSWRSDSRINQAGVAGAIVALLALGSRVPAMLGGLREVITAARARREGHA